jgi:hypothetical protein
LPWIGEFPLQPADHGNSEWLFMLPASSPRGHVFARVLGLVPPVVTVPIVVLVLLISLVLGGCSGRGQPAASVVQGALALQIQLTQSAIAEALQLKTPGAPEVSHVRVASTDAVRIGEGRGVRLKGAFDWRLAGDPVRVDSPFDIYLQRGARGQSWRLARPQGSLDGNSQVWITDPLPV